MNSVLQLLTSWEKFDVSPDKIKESRERNGGKIVLKGILQKADTLNQNGRVYPRQILEREVRNYQKLIRERRALGECDHPETSVVELKNVSHVITEAWFEGNVVMGKVELLDTPSGKILQNLVEAGITLGISSRGVGSTRREGDKQIVQDDFQLICWDVVSEPSTPNAFLHEGKRVQASEVSTILNKTDKVDRIFNEIIDWKR